MHSLRLRHEFCQQHLVGVGIEASDGSISGWNRANTLCYGVRAGWSKVQKFCRRDSFLVVHSGSMLDGRAGVSRPRMEKAFAYYFDTVHYTITNVFVSI